MYNKTYSYFLPIPISYQVHMLIVICKKYEIKKTKRHTTLQQKCDTIAELVLTQTKPTKLDTDQI